MDRSADRVRVAARGRSRFCGVSASRVGPDARRKSGSRRLAGYSLIQLMVALSSMTSVLAVLLIQFQNQRNSLMSDRVLMAKSLLRFRLDGLLLDRETQRRTLADLHSGNQALSGCMTGTCQPTTSTEFQLVDARGREVSGKFYDLSGNVCSAPGGDCMFRVTTGFEASCSTPPAAFCSDQDSAVRVWYVVAPASAALSRWVPTTTQSPKIPWIPPARVPLPPLKERTCEESVFFPGEPRAVLSQFMRGIKADGSPICTKSAVDVGAPCRVDSTGSAGVTLHIGRVSCCGVPVETYVGIPPHRTIQLSCLNAVELE